MKPFCSTLILLLAFAACNAEKSEPATSTPTASDTAVTTAPAAQPTATTASQTTEPAAEPDKGTWAGQVKIDAHAGMAWFNYVGAESGDFVPMRFRTDSEAGKKILAVCADDDLCEFEGTVRFLDEPPPENASAIGEIVTVDRVKKLPPDNR